MRKKMKKILCSLLVVIMCLTVAPLQGFVGFDWSWLDFSVMASDKTIITSGSCGSQVIYTLYDDGKLVISGIGPTYDYISASTVSPNVYTTHKKPWYNYASKISTVVVEEGVTYLGDGLLCSAYNEHNISSIELPDSLIGFGEEAFSEGAFEYIELPSQIKEIPNYSFRDCDNLKEICIPDGVTKVGTGAFSSCYSLTKVTLPNSLLTINSFAFYGCEELKHIMLSNNVTKIGNNAFNGCTSLESIIIPNSVTNIGSGVFYLCSGLKNVTIGNGATNIGSNTFRGCYSLESVMIGKNVTIIEENAFYVLNQMKDVYYCGTQEQWRLINIKSGNEGLKNATIHYNCKLPQDSYFMVSSNQYSVDSIHRKETATYKIHLLDKNSDFLPVNDVTVQNNTTDIVAISTKKVSDTELELTVEPIKDGDASISLFNGDGSVEQFFNFTFYSNTTTYRADQVPVTNEELKTNFSRGDLTVDNFEYYFDENKGKYIATMDVYNRSGAIGVVTAHKQNGLITAIEQVDPYIPLPGDFGEFLVYIGTGAVSYLKGESFNYRYAGDSQKTSIEIEVPEDGYISVSCDVKADDAVAICNMISIATDSIFKTADMVKALAKLGDKEAIAKKSKETLIDKVMEYSTKKPELLEDIVKKLYKSIPEQFDILYLKDLGLLSLDLVYELFKNAGVDFCEVLLDTIKGVAVDELKELGLMHVAKKLIEDEVVEAAEESLLKAASLMFKGGEYVNLLNNILGAYVYNDGTGKTDIVFKPKGENGFLCKDTVKVVTDVINKDVILNTYVVNYLDLQDTFVRDVIDSDFNRDDGLDEKEMNIDLKRIVEIREISLYENGKEIDKTFKATVEIDKPANMNIRTCRVYRVEKDGTYTKLNTRIEGNKIVFETDHFSHYIVTGIRNDIEGTTPCDEHVYEEVRTEPSCTEAGSIIYTCYCGDTHTETITKLSHTYNAVVTAPTCVEKGFTTYTCNCGDSYVSDHVATVEHNDNDGDEYCDYCDNFLGSAESNNCSHICHKSGFMGFIWKIINFFQKLFGTNPVCECGMAHY